MGIFVGVGIDGIRVVSYNFWLVLYWLIIGEIVGGLVLVEEVNWLIRIEVLYLYIKGSVYIFNEEIVKGILENGMYVDFVLLLDDYFFVLIDEIKEF